MSNPFSGTTSSAVARSVRTSTPAEDFGKTVPDISRDSKSCVTLNRTKLPLAASVSCVRAESTEKSSSFPMTLVASLVFAPRSMVSASNSLTSTRILFNATRHGTPDAYGHGQL